MRPTGTERIMSVRLSCYVEAVGLVKDGFVPIRGDHPQGRALTGLYELAVELKALDRPTGVVHHRRHVSQHLLDHQGRVTTIDHGGLRVGPLKQAHQPMRDQMLGGLGTTAEIEGYPSPKFILTEWRSVHTCFQEHIHKVASAGIAPMLLDESVGELLTLEEESLFVLG